MLPSVSLFALRLSLALGASYPETQPPKADAAAAPLASRYREAAERITSAALAGNDACNKLEELCVVIGHRLGGSTGLEKAVDWALAAMKKDGQENVRREKVMVPHWVRGQESAMLVEPRRLPLRMFALGGSIATPPEGITAPVLVVRSKDELDAVGDAARGKILLFNHVMPPYSAETGSGYGKAVQYRGSGAVWAAEKGAVASLIRSVTARSLGSPHTGAMHYAAGIPKIPAGAVSVEDAEMLARLQARGQTPVVTLRMEAQSLPDAESANVVGELRGTTLPEEVVVIGGHLDSWDVGQGAHDDGAGCVMAMEAINVLRKLNLIPRRTIRVVLFTNEENGLAGGKTYAEDHAGELIKHVAAIEADGGCFKPTGYGVECRDKERTAQAVEQMRDIVTLLAAIGPMKVSSGWSGADISPMEPAGVLLLGQSVEGSAYFDYHHSWADTIDKVDPIDLSQNVAVMATVAYILADMPERFGGTPDAEPATR